MNFFEQASSNNLFSTLIGAVTGGVTSLATSLMIFHLQRKNEELRQYELRGEFVVEKNPGKEHPLATLDVFLTNYSVKPNIAHGYLDFSLPEKGFNKRQYCKHTIYLRNVGRSTINQLDICVTEPKKVMLIPLRLLKDNVKYHDASFVVLCDERIPPNKMIRVNFYFLEEGEVINLFSSTLSIVYLDSTHQPYEQPLFPEQNKIYEASRLDWYAYNQRTRNISIIRRMEEEYFARQKRRIF